MIRSYRKFLKESKELDQDMFLDIFVSFKRILELHEKHYYNDNKISIDPEFKKKLTERFEKLRRGKTLMSLRDEDFDELSEEDLKKIRQEIVIIEDFYNLVRDYEKKLYGENNIALPDDDTLGNSFWDVCETLIEENDMMYVNDYISDFSDKNIYSTRNTQENREKIFGHVDNAIKGLDDYLDKSKEQDREDDLESESVLSELTKKYGVRWWEKGVYSMSELIEYLYENDDIELSNRIKTLEEKGFDFFEEIFPNSDEEE